MLIKSYGAFPAFTLPLPFNVKLLNVVWMKPGRGRMETRDDVSGPKATAVHKLWSSPTNVLSQSLLAGMQLAAERTLVLLLLKGGVAGVLAPVDTQIGLGGVALQADVALEWLLSSVHSGVTLILSFEKYLCIYKCIYCMYANNFTHTIHKFKRGFVLSIKLISLLY